MLRTANGKVLADRVIVADTFWKRLKGLLGQREMPHNTAMLFRNCTQVHMFFMRFDIGVIFLDKDNQVLRKQWLRPWRVSAWVKGAAAVLEVSPDVLEQLVVGEMLEIGP